MLIPIERPDIERIAEIIRSETGNQVAEKNHSMVVSRMRIHLGKIGVKNMSDYWTYFAAHELDERESLRNLMTTHYTFFFREYAHFDVLHDWIEKNGERLKSRFAATKKPVRVWSAASSRGQEVYSLATFLELELVKRFSVPYEVVGTDIDSESIAFARNGVYPIKEVNTIPQIYLSRFWKRGTGEVKDFAAVNPAVKAKCKFETLNLLEVDKWSVAEPFDVIFCRNVFIYFNDELVKKIALSLARRLDSNGLFVSGMSEAIRFPDWPLELVGPTSYSPKGAEFSKPRPNVVPLAAGSKSGEAGVPSKPLAVESVTPAQTSAGANLASPAPQPAKKKYRVLCVDDSSTIQMLMKKIFGQDPDCVEVVTALNGREAREKLDSAKLDGSKFDLITLDIHMPEVTGIEFLERLYKKSEDPPVIMISSVNRTDIDLATKSVALGAFDYVEKPAMNNLQKSAGEILTKAKMAMRERSVGRVSESLAFDSTIGQKIVVPDASLCLRAVVFSKTTIPLLEYVVKGQQGEYRSPPLLVLLNEGVDVDSEVEARVLACTDRTVTTVRGGSAVLKPNGVFIASYKDGLDLLKSARAKSISLQVLAENRNLSELKSSIKTGTTVQLLIDESLEQRRGEISALVGKPVSDLCPATSFASLSVEFFAMLRKAAA